MVLTLGGLGFKIAAFPFHMWVPDTYEAASTPFVAWLSVAPKAAGFVVMFRLYLEGVGDPVLLWVPVAAGLAAITIVAGNLMAIPQQNVKRLLAYSGIAHIGYMLVGFAAVSANGVAMMLFYLVAYLFGNMGAFFVVEAVAQSDGSEAIAAYKGLAQRSPVLALCMLLFLLSLRGGVLGQALRVLGRSGTRNVLARAGWCYPHRRGALLLPPGGEADVYRFAGAPAARARLALSRRLHPGVRGGSGGSGRVSQAPRDGGPARCLGAFLAMRSRAGLVAG